MERGKAVTELLVAESTRVDSVPTARLLMAVQAGVLSDAHLVGAEGREEGVEVVGCEDVRAAQLSHCPITRHYRRERDEHKVEGRWCAGMPEHADGTNAARRGARIRTQSRRAAVVCGVSSSHSNMADTVRVERIGVVCVGARSESLTIRRVVLRRMIEFSTNVRLQRLTESGRWRVMSRVSLVMRCGYCAACMRSLCCCRCSSLAAFSACHTFLGWSRHRNDSTRAAYIQISVRSRIEFT